MIHITHEKQEDIRSIYDINLKSFESDTEAELVDKLRGVVDPFISLLAKEDGIILGHILFTPVKADDSNVRAMGLGPMAVIPHRQGQGIGSALINDGLMVCRSMGVKAVFVLGEPEYYTRFGFELASKNGIYYKGDEFEPYFFMTELVPGALDGIGGEVFYHPLFDGV